ncbi:programmed cell death protein 2 [Condylostylus longicornis]|uniref:programmed cell death protein 2 n=1 Tax=Condylostylus longicornis TaxID=2530218 RepID=UPI00244E4C42|nr:programmed cell death protein 2 [Condylostylus longicornis]
METINWENHFDLGFAEECELPWLLLNRHFPSKIGGKPAWLDLENFPTYNEMKCPVCKEPRVLLCQIYCPIDEKEECFHRTIFVFVCKTESCYQENSSENILVLRSQLRRHNEYYPYEPPDENIELPELNCFKSLCSVCGCHGPLLCSRCKGITYCSSTHQRADWKYHKQICRGETASSTNKTTKHTVFPELQMVIEPEELTFDEPEQSETEEEAEKRRLREYEELQKSGKVGEFKDISDEELAKYAGSDIQDKQFKLFKKTIQSEPEQVLRYRRKGKPLWITTKEPTLQDIIPNCERCDSERCFEFQIMPQMLNYIKDDNIDWGVIAVYTCVNSCSIKGYAKEFCIKQDIISKPNDSITKTE